MKVRKTYKYRPYGSKKRDTHLHQMIDIVGIIWNHITALQKRYYRRFGKHISESRMKQHIAKLRMKTQKYTYWRKVGSQAVQDICERHEKVYEKFFEKRGGLPRFKKVKKYRSFTLKQAGWKLEDSHQGKKYRQIRIGKRPYKFVYHRPLTGDIKTISIKRDAVGNLWICFSVVEEMTTAQETSTGQSGGFDFGLRTFLTNDDGQKIDNPEYFKQGLPRLRTIQRQVSKKQKQSKNRQSGKKHIARRHIRIADKRRDFHYQLAHALCDQYDILVFEDLNIAAMKRLWGQKVSDLGFSQFIAIVEWVALKRGKQVVFIDRWERTTGICSCCGHKQNLELKDRLFCCENCGLILDRDHNAAINIRELGHQLILSQSEEDPCIKTGHPALTSEAH
ncbi:MAG: transposase [Anaerolineae bacterium]|nr:transposase [Anaerolineae bacterium]